MICPTCNGNGLHNGPFVGAIRANCATCNGRGTVTPEIDDDVPCGDDCDCCDGLAEPECGLVGIEVKTGDDLDWAGMARDLARTLAEANRNIDRLVAGLIDCAETVHRIRHLGDSWQDCGDPFCRKVADLLGSLVESETCEKRE